MKKKENKVLVYDIGGTWIRTIGICSGNIVGNLKELWKKNNDIENDLSQLVELGYQIFDKNSFQTNEVKIAISLPANFSEDGYIVKWPNRVFWEGINLKELLIPKLGKNIVLEEDANAALIAEMEFGKLNSIQNALFVTIGTGVGSGLVINGEIYKGNRKHAGELGHVIINPESNSICKCGKYGCLQPLSSGKFLEIEAKKIGLSNVEELIQKSETKDVFARKILYESARRLGTAIANIAFYLDVEKVVVTSRFCKESSLWWNELQNEYFQKLMNDKRHIPITKSNLINFGGILGAAIVAYNFWDLQKSYKNDISALYNKLMEEKCSS